MKYINHMTSSSDDEKHESLIEKCGMAGYGAYWVVVEKIAAQIRPECVSTSLTLSWRNWGRHLRTSPQQAQFWLRSMNCKQLIVLTEIDGVAKVDIPNILKYGDEYTKRLGINSRQTPDKLPTMSGLPAVPAVQAVQDQDQSLSPVGTGGKRARKQRTITVYPMSFLHFWREYPRPIEKKVALKSWTRNIEAGFPPADMVRSAIGYSQECARLHTEERFIKHPSTFLNEERWKSYLYKDIKL